MADSAANARPLKPPRKNEERPRKEQIIKRGNNEPTSGRRQLTGPYPGHETSTVNRNRRNNDADKNQKKNNPDPD